MMPYLCVDKRQKMFGLHNDTMLSGGLAGRLLPQLLDCWLFSLIKIKYLLLCRIPQYSCHPPPFHRWYDTHHKVIITRSLRSLQEAIRSNPNIQWSQSTIISEISLSFPPSMTGNTETKHQDQHLLSKGRMWYVILCSSLSLGLKFIQKFDNDWYFPADLGLLLQTKIKIEVATSSRDFKKMCPQPHKSLWSGGIGKPSRDGDRL